MNHIRYLPVVLQRKKKKNRGFSSHLGFYLRESNVINCLKSEMKNFQFSLEGEKITSKY